MHIEKFLKGFAESDYIQKNYLVIFLEHHNSGKGKISKTFLIHAELYLNSSSKSQIYSKISSPTPHQWQDGFAVPNLTCRVSTKMQHGVVK